MILLPFFLLPQPPAPATYDFYYQSVRKGTSQVALDGDLVTLESAPGFMEGSTLVMRLDGHVAAAATYLSKSAGRIVYALNAAPADRSAINAVGKSALYSPLYPGLLPYLLAEYDVDKGGFQSLPATD